LMTALEDAFKRNPQEQVCLSTPTGDRAILLWWQCKNNYSAEN